jgi:polar amino acid transport system permease protein
MIQASRRSDDVTEAGRASGESAGSLSFEPLVVKPLRHPARTAFAATVVAGLALFGHAIATSQNFDFHTVGQYLFSGIIINGVLRTLFLTVLAMAIASVLGVFLALARQSPSLIFRTFGSAYVWVFRGTPVLVQLILWFNLALVIPKLTFGIPGTGVSHTFLTNSVITPFTAALLGLALNEAAYMAEIIRGGILSVGRGQTEAALSLGMSHPRTIRRIVFPQAMRAIIPPAGNEVITCLKTTALVSIISYNELLGTVQGIYSVSYKTLEMLIVASIWYLACTTAFSVGQYFLERRYARGVNADGLRSAAGRRLLMRLRPGRVA